MYSLHFKVTVVWIILCVSTAASVGASTSSPTLSLNIAVLGVACIKIYLVMHYFMELDHAPLSWRALFATWTLAVFIVLTVLLSRGENPQTEAQAARPQAKPKSVVIDTQQSRSRNIASRLDQSRPSKILRPASILVRA
ncbi:MAG: cytochrome C oxidase subunit IV family protein [Pseudomonadota bacterium]